jgi:hypothetical protein
LEGNKIFWGQNFLKGSIKPLVCGVKLVSDKMLLMKWLYPQNNNSFGSNRNESKDVNRKHGKFQMEQESFYLLAFVSWLHNFDDLSHWEFRAGNKGIFAVIGFMFLFAQNLVLFDLAYEENLADYKCRGPSARLSVVVCAALVMLIVCLKMLSEERRNLCQRLVLIRHSTENSYYYAVYHIIFGEKRLRALKLLCMCIFQSFREYGVITFVYVAAIEQLMLFDTILDYIINSVVVLLIAELDELVFNCIQKAEVSENFDRKRQSFDEKFVDDEDHEKISVKSRSSHGSEELEEALAGAQTIRPFSNHEQSAVESALESAERGHVHAVAGGISHAASPHEEAKHPLLYKSEDGTISAMMHTHGRINSEDIEDSRRPSLLYNNYHSSIGPANVREMIALSLSHVEYDCYLWYDYFIIRLNYIVMLLPLLNGKITGNNCSERSVYRVSEIAMFGLFTIRVLLNVYIDVKLQLARGKWRRTISEYPGAWAPLAFWSLVEHSVPCAAYMALMYFVFVKEFKPESTSG